MIESFLLGLICVFLNLRVIDLQSESPWVVFNSVVALILVTAFALTPLVSLTIMYRNFGRLNERELLERYGEMYMGYNVSESRKMLIYWGAEYVRKVLIAVTLVFMRSHFWAQIIVFFQCTTILVIFAGYF